MTAEGDAAAPPSEILGQDDGSELRVKPVVLGTSRWIDLRIWRQGPAGLAPARTGLMLDEADMHALHHGLAELIEASDGGRRVARVVWDGAEGRRLRAETEPFGTRHLARLGFWQRVRSSWRPADDGLVFQADRMLQLQHALGRCRLWLRAQESPDTVAAILPTGNTLDRWPASGADWLTIEPERVAFHPRGVRITCSISERDDQHWLIVRQWQREDTLWLPDASSVDLGMLDLDAVLSALLRISGHLADGDVPEPEHCSCSNGSEIRIWLASQAGKNSVCIEQFRADAEEAGVRLSFPVDDLPRFGRALVQGWYLLAGWLSEGERAALRRTVQSRRDLASAEPATEPAGEQHPLEQHPLEPETVEQSEPVESREVAPESVCLPPVLCFAAESPTPGALIPGSGTVRIEVEGPSGASAVTMSNEAAAAVLPGLAELEHARNSQRRPDPMLLFERSDCSVFGRLGTRDDVDTVELRVWSGPVDSEAIDLAAACLPDLIDCLQMYLEMSGVGFFGPLERQPAGPPASVVDPAHPTEMRPLAGGLPLDGPGRGRETVSSDTVSLSLGTISLGEAEVTLSLYGRVDSPILCVSWQDGSLDLALSHLQQLLDALRALYYDAMRGRRGSGVTVSQYPVVTVSMENMNGDLSAVLRQEMDGEFTTLWFPARQVPSFLDAAEVALSRA